MKEIMLSGGRPTGKLHLGHYVGAFKTFVDLQEHYDNYFIISDIHMLTTKATKKEIDTIFENSSFTSIFLLSPDICVNDINAHTHKIIIAYWKILGATNSLFSFFIISIQKCFK